MNNSYTWCFLWCLPVHLIIGSSKKGEHLLQAFDVSPHKILVFLDVGKPASNIIKKRTTHEGKSVVLTFFSSQNH